LERHVEEAINEVVCCKRLREKAQSGGEWTVRDIQEGK
jgi:hypothetical protein